MRASDQRSAWGSGCAYTISPLTLPRTGSCRNNHGQLGDGAESERCRCSPAPVEAFEDRRYFVLDAGCGDGHTAAIGGYSAANPLQWHRHASHSRVLISVRITKKDRSESAFVYAWGDDSSLQLGSCDSKTRATPNEVTPYHAQRWRFDCTHRRMCDHGMRLQVRWVSKFLAKHLDGAAPRRIAVGGGHNLLLTEGVGESLS